MTPPQSIKIGPLTYRVEYEEDANEAANTFGHIRFGKQVIRVDSTVSLERQRLVLLHEVLHGLFEMANLDSHPDQEQIIRLLTPGLLTCLRENRDLSHYLLRAGRS